REAKRRYVKPLSKVFPRQRSVPRRPARPTKPRLPVSNPRPSGIVQSSAWPIDLADIMAILVTGGAGYIGSVTVTALLAGGEEPVVLDNLVYGHREAIPGEVPFYEGDIGDSDLVGKIAAEHDITACMHFSAYAYVGESVEHPKK